MEHTTIRIRKTTRSRLGKFLKTYRTTQDGGIDMLLDGWDRLPEYQQLAAIKAGGPTEEPSQGGAIAKDG
ncbi:MAG TPA: hypothetical protein VNA25_12140 [Phycisphaerae bacterium]|nr:hypothetical protein [Phycisphaerae bacterium]